jgi:septum formation protein
VHILLASSSPRRQALLAQLDIPCRVQVPEVDEDAILREAMPPGVFPSLEMSRIAACKVAEAKAENVLAALRAASAVARPSGAPDPRQGADPCVIVAADTMVVCEGKVLNKPGGDDEARAMLAMLGGKTHHVVSGLCLRGFDQAGPDRLEGRTEAEVTAVTFRTLNDPLINAYIATGEPFDKAGGYGIQSIGAALVERIDGCYTNVVGLPVALLCKLLAEMGHPVESFWTR